MEKVPYLDDQVAIVTTTLTSSAILNSAATNIFQVVGDSVYIEDIVIETDGTGLATGTLFQIKKTDAVGNPIILSHAVSALGANVTFDFSTATTKNRSLVSANKYITSYSTAADCTGAGTIRVTIRYRRCNENSRIQPV